MICILQSPLCIRSSTVLASQASSVQQGAARTDSAQPAAEVRASLHLYAVLYYKIA